MKIPFSYQHSFFKIVLLGSVLCHGLFFLNAAYFSVPPRYGVEQAPSSMEVFILKRETPEKEQEEEDRVYTALDPDPKAEAVHQIARVKEPEKKQPQRTVYIPASRGAVTQAVPDHLRNPAPVYPALARANGWQGLTLLRVRVGADGAPKQVLISQTSGHRILDESAVNAVRKWLFSPARVGPVNLESWVEIPVRFVLETKG